MGRLGDWSQSHWGLCVGLHVRLRKVGPLCFLPHEPLVIRMFPEVSDGADFISGNCPESWWGACRSLIWMLLLCAVLSPLGAQQKVRALQLDVQGTEGRPPLSLHPAQSPAHTTAHTGFLCPFTHPLTPLANTLSYPCLEPRNTRKNGPVPVDHVFWPLGLHRAVTPVDYRPRLDPVGYTSPSFMDYQPHRCRPELCRSERT